MQLRLVEWMRDKTCGLCGQGNGDIKQDFRTPNGQLVDNPTSFAHSWVLPVESCSDNSRKKILGSNCQMNRCFISD